METFGFEPQEEVVRFGLRVTNDIESSPVKMTTTRMTAHAAVPKLTANARHHAAAVLLAAFIDRLVELSTMLNGVRH